MPSSNGTFTLTITTNALFGETGRPHTENGLLRYVLLQVAQDVGSGAPSRPILDQNRNVVGSYSFGSGMINAGR
jgi:hypothetical protein